jgi:hypothetical protein
MTERYTKDYLKELYRQGQEKREREQRTQTDVTIVLRGVIQANEEGYTKYVSPPFFYRERDSERLEKGVKALFVDAVVEVSKEEKGPGVKKVILHIDWS